MTSRSVGESGCKKTCRQGFRVLYVPEIELYRHDCCSRGLAHYSHVLSEGSGVVLNHKVLGSNPTGTWLRP